MQNKKTVRITVNHTTADETVARIFHPKRQGEECCQEDDEIEDDEEPARLLCQECFGVGYKGGYDDGGEIEADEINITQQISKHQENTSKLDFCCQLYVHIYIGCLLWLDDRGWEVMGAEQEENFLSPEMPFPIPTNLRVTARSLAPQEVETKFLEQFWKKNKLKLV